MGKTVCLVKATGLTEFGPIEDVGDWARFARRSALFGFRETMRLTFFWRGLKSWGVQEAGKPFVQAFEPGSRHGSQTGTIGASCPDSGKK